MFAVLWFEEEDKKDTGVSVKRRRVPGTLDKVRTKTEIMSETISMVQI